MTRSNASRLSKAFVFGALALVVVSASFAADYSATITGPATDAPAVKFGTQLTFKGTTGVDVYAVKLEWHYDNSSLVPALHDTLQTTDFIPAFSHAFNSQALTVAHDPNAVTSIYSYYRARVNTYDANGNYKEYNDVNVDASY